MWYLIFLSKECLHHAVKENNYDTVAALVFVMDRFSYWQGSSHKTLELVDYLKTNSPVTPIAPQLLIRKARVMKNAGNLHGMKVTAIFNFSVSSGIIAKIIKRRNPTKLLDRGTGLPIVGNRKTFIHSRLLSVTFLFAFILIII